MTTAIPEQPQLPGTVGEGETVVKSHVRRRPPRAPRKHRIPKELSGLPRAKGRFVQFEGNVRLAFMPPASLGARILMALRILIAAGPRFPAKLEGRVTVLVTKGVSIKTDTVSTVVTDPTVSDQKRTELIDFWIR